MRAQYTDSQLEEIANWSIGQNVRDTCSHFGCSSRVVLKARMKFIDPETVEWKSGPVPQEVKLDLKQRMQLMRDSGMSIKEVSDAVDKPRSFVHKHTTCEPRKHGTLTEDELRQAQEMRDAGCGLEFIARKMEVSRAYIQSHTIKSNNSMPLSRLISLSRSGDIPNHPIQITACGEVIGTFTPKNSAH